MPSVSSFAQFPCTACWRTRATFPCAACSRQNLIRFCPEKPVSRVLCVCVCVPSVRFFNPRMLPIGKRINHRCPARVRPTTKRRPDEVPPPGVAFVDPFYGCRSVASDSSQHRSPVRWTGCYCARRLHRPFHPATKPHSGYASGAVNQEGSPATNVSVNRATLA